MITSTTESMMSSPIYSALAIQASFLSHAVFFYNTCHRAYTSRRLFRAHSLTRTTRPLWHERLRCFLFMKWRDIFFIDYQKCVQTRVYHLYTARKASSRRRYLLRCITGPFPRVVLHQHVIILYMVMARCSRVTRGLVKIE